MRVLDVAQGGIGEFLRGGREKSSEENVIKLFGRGLDDHYVMLRNLVLPETTEKLGLVLVAPDGLPRALGEALTEPKPHVVFEPGRRGPLPGALRLDRRSRMLYDAHHVFLNGESWRASGADARLMRRLADRRRLGGVALARASDAARELISQRHTWRHRVQQIVTDLQR